MDTLPTNDIVTISDALSRNGLGFVLLSVFIVIFLALFTFIMYSNKKNIDMMKDESKKQIEVATKQSEEMFSNMMNQYNHVITTLMEQAQQKQIAQIEKKEEHKDLVKIFLKINDALKPECTSLQREIDCDRLAIYVFHNGQRSSHGFPFIKTSCISEYLHTGSGLVGEMKNQTGIPLGMLDELIQSLYNNSEFIVNDPEALKEQDPMSYGFICSQKLNCAILIGVYDDDGEMIGFVLSSFKNILPIEEINLKKRSIIEFTLKIKPVLQLSDFTNYES